MKALMQSRYVGWMAIRPLTFGKDEFAPGDRVPQKVLETMRDPEVLVRTGRLAAVAKDMNKVPRYLRKIVVSEKEMKARILAPRIASQIGAIVPTAQMGKPVPEPDEPRGVGGSGVGYNPDLPLPESVVIAEDTPVDTEDDENTPTLDETAGQEPVTADTEVDTPKAKKGRK